MDKAITTLGFDADDTLWHNEQYFQLTESAFAELLADFSDRDALSSRLLDAERRNLRLYGYGAKGFTLSMIETAIEVTVGRVDAATIHKIIEAGHALLDHPAEPFPGVRVTLDALSNKYRLVLITKGDLFDQERKLAQSGLGEMFDAVEIVSEKTDATYTTLFARHGDGPHSAAMVGNSVRSDIVPALEAGSWGVHIPHDLTWALEHAETPESHLRYRKANSIVDLPDILDEIDTR